MSDENSEFLELLGSTNSPALRTTYRETEDFSYINASPINSCQWSILGDGTFSASTSTIKKLPSDSYSVKLDCRDNLLVYRVSLTTDELIKFTDDVSNRIIESIKTFWSSRDKFKKAGQIFKRGILLWGPPGSGKSVTIVLLAKDVIERGGVVFYCDNPHLLSRAIDVFRKIERDRPVLVILEDIDEIIDKHGESGILSILDGHLQIDNIVNIATTNYPERLASRLVNRPSRFDEVIKVPMPSKNQRYEYFKSKVKENITHDELERWSADTEGFSVAHLRELVISVCCLNNTYEAVIQRLTGMSRRISSESDNSGKLGFLK